MNWYKSSQSQEELLENTPPLSPEELRDYEFDAAEWGHSITPKKAFDKRDDKDEFETLADIASYDDQWRLGNVLGKGWEGHWENVIPSTYLIPDIKAGNLITIYRASKDGSIMPGSYVTESKEYAIFHGETTIPGDYQISSIQVYSDELLTYDDPHEFLYIPRNLQIAHERLKD